MDAIDSAQKMRMDFQAVIDRLKVALGVESNRSVADHLGMSSSNLGERKNRGALPSALIQLLCQEQGINYGWVMSGVGEMRDRPPSREVASKGGALQAREPLPEYGRPTPAPPVRASPFGARKLDDSQRDLLEAALGAVELELERRNISLPADRRTRLVWALYQMSLPTGQVPDHAVRPLVDLVHGC